MWQPSDRLLSPMHLYLELARKPDAVPPSIDAEFA